MKAGVGVLTSENFRAQNTSKDKKVISWCLISQVIEKSSQS